MCTEVIFLHDMKKLLQIIKQAAIDVYNAQKPCDYCYGTITSVAPFCLKLDNSNEIPEEMLVFLDSTQAELSEGDKVVVLRKSGGQKFLILGRLAI